MIYNGDVYDIGQTINGVSTFLWLSNEWYYIESNNNLTKYNYNHQELTNTVLLESSKKEAGFINYDDVQLLGNIFKDTNNFNLNSVIQLIRDYKLSQLGIK
jgi:hypothetical protein